MNAFQAMASLKTEEPRNVWEEVDATQDLLRRIAEGVNSTDMGDNPLTRRFQGGGQTAVAASTIFGVAANIVDIRLNLPQGADAFLVDRIVITNPNAGRVYLFSDQPVQSQFLHTAAYGAVADSISCAPAVFVPPRTGALVVLITGNVGDFPVFSLQLRQFMEQRYESRNVDNAPSVPGMQP